MFDWQNALDLDLLEQGERVWLAWDNWASAGWDPYMDLHYALYLRGIDPAEVTTPEEIRAALQLTEVGA